MQRARRLLLLALFSGLTATAATLPASAAHAPSEAAPDCEMERMRAQTAMFIRQLDAPGGLDLHRATLSRDGPYDPSGGYSALHYVLRAYEHPIHPDAKGQRDRFADAILRNCLDTGSR